MEAGDADGIYRYVIAPFLDEYASLTFENVCREYLRHLNRQDKLPFHFTSIGNWQDKERELDIIAFGKNKKDLLLGECKFRRNAPFGTADMKAALEKYTGGNKPVWYFFSRSGFGRKVKEWAAGQSGEGLRINPVSLAEIVKGTVLCKD
jgi:hypothetical protein